MTTYPARLKRGCQVGHLSRRGLILDVVVTGICVVANEGAFSLLQILTPSNAIFTWSTRRI